MDINFSKDTVGDIVRKDYRTAKVFKDHRIDFCCGGGKSVEQVCEDKKLDKDQVIKEIMAVAGPKADGSPDFDSWPLDLLADYIEKKHHRYVEANSPQLLQYLKKLAAVHGKGAPYLIEMYEVFGKSAGNLAMHMKKEELVLFPYIKKLCGSGLKGTSVTAPSFGTVNNPIAAMMYEHDTEGEHFRKLEELSNGYEIPDWACNTYAVTMQLLQEFQDDLHLHIHLENNILFPKAAQLEASLTDQGYVSQGGPQSCSI